GRSVAEALRLLSSSQMIRPPRLLVRREMDVETLLASVNRRIEAYRVHQDASAVLADDALEDVSRLWQEAWAASPDGGIPANVAVAVAMLHWCRHEALPDGADHGEGCRLAVDILTAILPAAPELVPPDVRRQLPGAGGAAPDTYEQRVDQIFAIATHAHEVLESAVQLDDDAALEHAIALLRRGLAASPDDNPVKAMCLSYLGEALETRFERAGNLADLDEAIQAHRAAASTFAEDHKFYAPMQSALYHSLQTRFEQLGERSDLDDAIQAIRLAAGAQPDELTYLGNLGNSLRARFEFAGNPADLDEAIQAGRAALDAAAESDLS